MSRLGYAILIAVALGQAVQLSVARAGRGSSSKPLSSRMVSDWDRVVRGSLPYARFRELHRPTNSQVGQLRGSLSEGQIQALGQDWRRIVVREKSMTSPAFLKERGFDKGTFQPIRTGREQTFPYASAGTGFTPEQLRAMRADWDKVKDREPGWDRPRFMTKWNLGVKAFNNLRAAEKGFEKIPRGAINRVQVDQVKIDRMIRDWDARVMTGLVDVDGYLKDHDISLKAFNKYVRGPNREAFRRAPPANKRRINPNPAADAFSLSSDQQVQVKKLITAYQDKKFNRSELWKKLRPMGITPAIWYGHLDGKYPDLRLAKRGTRRHTEVRKNELDHVVDTLVSTYQNHRQVIWKQADLFQIVNNDPALRGTLDGKTLTRNRFGNLRKLGRELGDERLDQLALDIRKNHASLPGNAQRRAAAESGTARTSHKKKENIGERSIYRQVARELSNELAGKPVERSTYVATKERLRKKHGLAKSAMQYVQAKYQGLFPEIARWTGRRRQPYSLRFVARMMMSLHEAGPHASGDDLRRIFTRSAEHAARPESGLENQQFLGEQARNYPDLFVSPTTRKRFQNAHVLLEAVRTAKEGTTLTEIVRTTPGLSFTKPAQAVDLLDSVVLKGQFKGHLNSHTIDQLRRRTASGSQRYAGLGQRKDPGFDPAAEPPWINMKLVRSVLDTPTMPPLLKHALGRLNGARPFAGHNVMLINHRYSDIVPFTEAMKRAGMEAATTVFVSTPYPFDPAVTRQLQEMDIDPLIPRLDMHKMEQMVEQGIKKLLDKNNRSILILDDGGMAAKVIEKKFPNMAGRFKIVEITAAGHRIAGNYAKRKKRLPFQYSSNAYSPTKREVTSEFHAKKVVEKTLGLASQNERTTLKNKRVAIIGGGPMGLFAGLDLRQKGHDVTFVDINPEVAKMLSQRYKFRVEPIERALPGRGLILGMTGVTAVTAQHLPLIDNDAVLVSGSSKQVEFAMSDIQRAASSRKLIQRTDGLSQESYTYTIGRGSGAKRLHILGDGWAINHNGSLHGSGIQDMQLELAIIFETAVRAARTKSTHTGKIQGPDPKVENMYIKLWKQTRR